MALSPSSRPLPKHPRKSQEGSFETPIVPGVIKIWYHDRVIRLLSLVHF